MRTRYIGGPVTALAQTDKAFCCKLDWSDQHGYVTDEIWIPLSVIDEDYHDDIDEAVRGDVIEIYVPEWFMEKNF